MITLWDVLFQVMLGLCITFGFGVLFNVPRTALLPCALIGTTGHILKFSLRQSGVSLEVATFVGAFAVGLVGYLVARRLQMPRLVFTVTGIISMVPGIPAYESILQFAAGNMLNGLQNAVRATLITGAIAGGLSTARLLTEFGEHAH